ncbi:unnamed protein product, partial [Pleuronectes platessa]
MRSQDRETPGAPSGFASTVDMRQQHSCDASGSRIPLRLVCRALDSHMEVLRVSSEGCSSILRGQFYAPLLICYLHRDSCPCGPLSSYYIEVDASIFYVRTLKPLTGGSLRLVAPLRRPS